MAGHAFLGELEQILLLAILQLGDDAYGVSVQKEIEDRSGRRVSRGALYVTLDRLESKGYVRSRQGASTAARGGRPRRYLSVSPAGVEALQSSRSMLRSLSTGLEQVLDER